MSAGRDSAAKPGARGATPSAPVAFSSGIPAPRARGLRRLLSRGALPREETCEWVFDSYAWLLSHLDGYEMFRETPLVLPTDRFFPVPRGATGPSLARALFERAAEHAGLPDDWDLRLAPLKSPPTTLELLGDRTPFGASAPRDGAITALDFADDHVTIQYAPHLLERPELFVAALAYEFARLLLLDADEDDPPPGVDTMDGPFLELAATFLGFGVFTANSVYNLETVQNLHTQGWNVHSLGVLSEVEVSYALALFLALKGDGLRDAKRHLNANPRSYVQSALKVIERDGARSLAALRAISPTEPEPVAGDAGE